MSWLMDEVRRPFDLRDDALVRVILAKVAPDSHLLLINLHHAVTDGRSLAVLKHELSVAYAAAIAKQEPQLPALAVQYGDYAYWQRQWMAQGHLDHQLAFWRTNLEGLQALQLPTDFPRPANLPLEGAQVAFTIPTDLAARMRGFARAQNSTFFGVMLGVYAAMLGRYGGASDVAIASVVANRSAPEVEVLMGYFVNTVIFRAGLGGSFEQLLGHLRETAVNAFSNGSAPYASVLDAAKLDPSAVPAMFVFQDTQEQRWDLDGLAVEEVALPRTAALFDITLEVQEDSDGPGSFSGLIVYNTSLWTQSRASRFRDSLKALAAAAIAEPTLDLVSLSAVSEAEHVQLLCWGGHNQHQETAPSCVEEFRAQLVKNAKRPAIIHGDITITYAEFGRSVFALEGAIRKTLQGGSSPLKGNGANDSDNSSGEAVVGVLLSRSKEMATAIWATLLSGAAYAPIDPEYPSERIALILENARPQLLLCRDEHASLAAGVPALPVSAWPAPTEASAAAPPSEAAAPPKQVSPSQLAYIIYTSGSTGRPKGVAVEHGAVANMIREQIRLMGIQCHDRVLQFFKPAFDGAVQEYLSTPCAGAALVLWDSGESFADVLYQKRVTVATLTPSALSALDEPRLPRLEKVAVAAEACPPALASTWAFGGRKLINAYGPSEGCVLSTFAELQADMSQAPIGRPLHNVQCYVFEPTRLRSLQPVGVAGELCIGGAQLARGYHREPAKTAEKFISNPLDNSRMYRSGDLVSWLPSGNLIYLGRNDEMVKIRGFRVELTEVEAALAAAGAQSVAVGLNRTQDALWAWVTPETLLPSQLKSSIQRTLPQYMVPQRIYTMPQLPLTPNGKIDKPRLLKMACDEEAASSAAGGGAGGSEGPPPEPAQSALEQKVLDTVKAVLGVEALGATTELKTNGMSSLKSVLLAQRLRDIHLAVPLGELYELPTVRAIAERLESEHSPGSFAAVVAADGAAGERRTCRGLTSCLRRAFETDLWILLRVLTWMWIAGVVIWPAVVPLWSVSQFVLPKYGLWPALAWLALVAYPSYLLGVVALAVTTKWVVIGRYRASAVSVDSYAFLRWWAVDRLLTFTSETVLASLRGGPLYFAYLRALGLRARGYARIDTRFVSEVDLISLGVRCVVAEGAKLRPAVMEAGVLHLRPMVFGNRCAIGENAVCTSGCAAGDDVTLQPLSLFSGRVARTLPDGSVWKGAPLVRSRGQRMRFPTGRLGKDLRGDLVALLLSLVLIIACSAVGYCIFGAMAVAQGLTDWDWLHESEGWLFAAVWLLFGPPVMASADVLMGLDLATYADNAAKKLGDSRTVFGLRVALMVVVSYAAFGWALTLSSALVCRVLRGSRRRNSPIFQIRRLILRMTFPRYPAQLSGTMGMALYLRLLGGNVAASSTVSLADPPLEPRKLMIAAGSMVMGPLALGECFVGERGLVGGGSVLLPHADVEAGAVVGAMSVVGLPVRSGRQLVGNPGVVMRRAELGSPPPMSCGRAAVRLVLRCAYPVLAPMVLQFLLLVTLLPAMVVLTIVMDSWLQAPGTSTDAASLALVSLALAPAYVLLGACLAVVAVVLKWVLLGRIPVGGRWTWMGSWSHHLFAFVQSLSSLSVGIFVGMTFGSPLYNWWLRCLGARVASDAVVFTQVTDFDCVQIDEGAVVEKEAVLSGQRLLPARGGGQSEFCSCFARVRVGERSTISHSAVLAAAETFELSVLAPLSALGPSSQLPARTLALGSPPQKFVWSKERDNLVKPSSRPLPRELNPPVALPTFVLRALSRMKVQSDAAPQPDQQMFLITGATGFLGRFLVAALLEATSGRVLCLVRAANPVVARERVIASLRKAAVPERFFDRVEAVPSDLSQRSLGLSYADFSQLAGRVTHVFHSAAKVNLTEPFELMRLDNIDATAHLLEFCCSVQPKPFHHISTMGVLTPDMLNRHGVIPENARLGDMRGLPLYGTGDQANGYPYTKWVAEALVFEAANRGLPAFVHRPGLIGGDSRTGVLAEDVFYHFLSDVVKSREIPAMEGAKFNLTPVDWVAKAIVCIATSTDGMFKEPGSAFHPAADGNTVTMEDLATVLSEAGYSGLRKVDFTAWRAKILAHPDRFKSWSFCASLAVDGDGLDAMAGNSRGGKAIREVVGDEAFEKFEPRVCLRQMLRYCREAGLLQA